MFVLLFIYLIPSFTKIPWSLKIRASRVPKNEEIMLYKDFLIIPQEPRKANDPKVNENKRSLKLPFVVTFIFWNFELIFFHLAMQDALFLIESQVSDELKKKKTISILQSDHRIKWGHCSTWEKQLEKGSIFLITYLSCTERIVSLLLTIVRNFFPNEKKLTDLRNKFKLN